MKLAKTQRAAIAALIPSTILIFIYVSTNNIRDSELIDAMLWNRSNGIPPLLNIIAKIWFIALLTLVFYPIIKRTIDWIKRG